ncbi:MAG: FtsQ-type POTRA domain-containing protein [Alicyclobacillus sp.]|nr:FtsQ-type POTRA domain-containing protein [Alicyclobacillus sp.]
MRVWMAGFFAVIGLVVVLESPLTRVRQIQVDGNTTIPAARLIADSGLTPGLSLWQINRAAVEAAVTSKEPFVQSVDVQVNAWSRTVTLHVHEKQIAAVYTTNGEFFRLLSDGTVYDELSMPSGVSGPILTTAPAVRATVGKVLPHPYASVVCAQLAKADPEMLVDVSEIHVDDSGIAVLYLDNRFQAKLRASQLSQLLPKLHDAVAYFIDKGYPPGVIDMTGNPPYQYTPFATGKGGSS